MPDLKNKDRERAPIATGDELAALLHHPSADVLLALLDNPALDETQLCLLLERKDLPGEILVQVAILPGISGELKRNAEEPLIARLPQLPLGQKIPLARRGPARVAGALLAEGQAQVISVVLDNPYMTEAQILKVLSREKLPAPVIPAIVRHRKWSISYNVRLALVRHAAAPLVVG